MIRSRRLVHGQTREEARAKLKPGNFQGTPPEGRLVSAEFAAIDVVDDRWFDKSRYQRLARVVANESLTPTGTFRVSLKVADDDPFVFAPGQFVGVEAEFPGRGFRRSPYCILSDPADAPRFDLLVRAVPNGPLSLYLADLEPGDEVVRSGKAGNGDPLAVSDLFELLPAFLSHHPDQEEPAPTHVERPWNRPA